MEVFRPAVVHVVRLMTIMAVVLGVCACGSTVPTPNVRAKAIAAAAFHTCALTRIGAVECWGDNEYGQIGDGTTREHKTPIAVKGLAHVSAIAAGGSHTCALTTTHAVECWGEASWRVSYQALYGDKRRLVGRVVAVKALPRDVTNIAVGGGPEWSYSNGGGHACARTRTGAIWCWGDNGYGELGGSRKVESIRPVKVENLPPATTVAAGGYHTCALTRAGAVWCWGDNTYGQLGDGTTHPSRRPVRVDGLPSASGIAGGGDDTCALTRSRAVWCWGDNQFGELGDGTTHDRHAPVAVTGLPPVAALAVGPLHTCALTMKARVACWGENLDGELGDGTKMNRVRPVSVSGLHGTVSAITAGGWESDTGTLDEYTCALTTTGAIKCWGGNFFGYLGDGTTHAREMPVSVTGFGPRGR